MSLRNTTDTPPSNTGITLDNYNRFQDDKALIESILQRSQDVALTIAKLGELSSPPITSLGDSTDVFSMKELDLDNEPVEKIQSSIDESFNAIKAQLSALNNISASSQSPNTSHDIRHGSDKTDSSVNGRKGSEIPPLPTRTHPHTRTQQHQPPQYSYHQYNNTSFPTSTHNSTTTITPTMTVPAAAAASTTTTTPSTQTAIPQSFHGPSSHIGKTSRPTSSLHLTGNFHQTSHVEQQPQQQQQPQHRQTIPGSSSPSTSTLSLSPPSHIHPQYHQYQPNKPTQATDTPYSKQSHHPQSQFQPLPNDLSSYQHSYRQSQPQSYQQLQPQPPPQSHAQSTSQKPQTLPSTSANPLPSYTYQQQKQQQQQQQHQHQHQRLYSSSSPSPPSVILDNPIYEDTIERLRNENQHLHDEIEKLKDMVHGYQQLSEENTTLLTNLREKYKTSLDKVKQTTSLELSAIQERLQEYLQQIHQLRVMNTQLTTQLEAYKAQEYEDDAIQSIQNSIYQVNGYPHLVEQLKQCQYEKEELERQLLDARKRLIIERNNIQRSIPSQQHGLPPSSSSLSTVSYTQPQSSSTTTTTTTTTGAAAATAAPASTPSSRSLQRPPSSSSSPSTPLSSSLSTSATAQYHYNHHGKQYDHGNSAAPHLNNHDAIDYQQLSQQLEATLQKERKERVLYHSSLLSRIAYLESLLIENGIEFDKKMSK